MNKPEWIDKVYVENIPGPFKLLVAEVGGRRFTQRQNAGDLKEMKIFFEKIKKELALKAML